MNIGSMNELQFAIALEKGPDEIYKIFEIR